MKRNISSISCRCYCLFFILIFGFVRASEQSPQFKKEFLIANNQQGEEFTSLEAVQQTIREQNLTDSAIISIHFHVLNLSTEIVFSHLDFLRLIGSNKTTEITCNTTNTGILFHNVSSLEINNVTFISCGRQVRNYYKPNYYSALTLMGCVMVVISNLTVRNSNGVGMMILKHQGESIAIISSVFEDNNITSDGKVQPDKLGGGGVYVYFDTQYLGTSISVIFHNCTFKNNMAHTRYYQSIFTDLVGRDFEGYGRGGGLFLAFEQDMHSTVVNTTISDCNFIGNLAFIGSGLSINMKKVHEQSIIVLILDTNFINNGCNYTNRGVGIGGGIHLSFNSCNRSVITSNITIRNVHIISNCAQHGGGVFIYSHKQNSNKQSNLLFDKCTFKNNTAITGSALDTSPDILERLSSGYMIIPTFKSCEFLGNYVQVNTDHYENGVQRNAGIATLYASLCDVVFEGLTLFKDNKGTAIYIVNGNANFHQGSARFENNHGLDGGALALIGVSSFVVGPSNTYEFTKNEALHRGGAIFVQMIDNHEFHLSKSCFIQYKSDTPLASLWDTNISFIQNHATLGQSIYTTSVFPCQIINNASNGTFADYVRTDTTMAFESRGISFDDQRNITEHVATDGGKLCVNQVNENSVSQLSVVPGHYQNHGVRIYNDLNMLVSEPLRTAISKNDNCTVQLASSSLFTMDKVKLLGQPGSRTTISLQTVSPRQDYITLSIELLECPPGFNIHSDRCECDALSYVGILGCNKTHSYLTPGFWAGLIEDETTVNVTQLATSTCPQGYCSTQSNSIKVVLPRNRSLLEETICGKNNRRGVLCGSCIKNYTVYFHSIDNRCRVQHLCHLGWLFYIISELIPVTLVFVTVVVLNISFTSGAVNGFILFSQLLVSIDIDASGIIQLPKSTYHAINGYTIIYGFLNLDFFHSNATSFCLWKHASTLDVIAFKYITIAYALLLVVSVVLFMNKCGGRCLGKCCRITTIKSSVIHGISAFFIVCYSQAVKTSLNLLNGHSLELNRNQGESNVNFTLSKRIWLNGDLKYFGKVHLYYAIPALFCLLTIGILPPLLLLIYPLLNKVFDILRIGDSRAVKFLFRWLIPVNTLKPLLDSFQGCFKDNLRFFAGLYFLYRWSALLAYTISSKFFVAYMVTQGSFTIMLVIHALFQPYISRVCNIIDTFLFADLVFINFITLIHYSIFRSEEAKLMYKLEVKNSAALQMVLVYTPLVLFTFYVSIQTIKLLLRCCKNICGIKTVASNTFSDESDIGMRPLRMFIQNFGLNSEYRQSSDLPHRLMISESNDADCFKDTDHENIQRGCYRKADTLVTY